MPRCCVVLWKKRRKKSDNPKAGEDWQNFTNKQTNKHLRTKWQVLWRRNVKGNTYKCRLLLPFAGAAWLWRSADLWPPSWGPGHPAPSPGLLGSAGLWPRGSDACTPGVRCKTTMVTHAEVLTLWPVTWQALNKIYWYITAIQIRMPHSKGKVCYSSVSHGKSVGAQKLLCIKIFSVDPSCHEVWKLSCPNSSCSWARRSARSWSRLTLHTLIGMGSAALAAAIAVPRQGDLNFPQRKMKY